MLETQNDKTKEGIKTTTTKPQPTLQVITCTPMYQRYLIALQNTAAKHGKSLLDGDQSHLAQLVFYGVKYVTTHRYNHKDYIEREELESHFQFIECIRQFIRQLTPRKFVNLFPVTKTYDGDKYQMKAYFYTMDMLKSCNMDEPLGDKLEDFMWDYQNDTISEFMIAIFSTASKLRKLNGGKGIFEEFAEENGIATFTINERGGYILNNQTHKTVPYKKPTPDYIQIR